MWTHESHFLCSFFGLDRDVREGEGSTFGSLKLPPHSLELRLIYFHYYYFVVARWGGRKTPEKVVKVEESRGAERRGVK